MAEKSTWRDPKALALWVMTALVLWLLIPAGATLGIQVWRWQNPGVTWEYTDFNTPPYLYHGLIGLAVAAILVIAICLKLQLGLLWLAVAVLLAGPLWAFSGYFPGRLGIVAVTLVPPIVSALIFKPKPPKE